MEKVSKNKNLLILDMPDMDKARNRSNLCTTYFYNYVPKKELKNLLQNKKFLIETYGCQANYRDEENIVGILSSFGMERTNDIEKSDLIILNTCAVRENAEDKVYGKIGDIKRLKEVRKHVKLVICGCMVEQNHIIEKLLNTFRCVDVLMGTHNIKDFPKLLEETYLNKKRVVCVSSNVGNVVEGIPSIRNEKFKAFVNISYGCDKFCTYCIVPYTRGKERSRDFNEIIKECKELVDQGYQEITLLGQNVDAYGKDLDAKYSFANLLEEVAKLNIPRLRFLTSYPSDFKDEVIDVMAKYPNIMKYLHLPVQSGNNDVLRRMARRYTREEYLDLVKRIRNKMPEIALATDIIVGFPNETYEEFLDTVSLCKEVNYSNAFTFIYSPRRGTPAAKIEDKVSYAEKSKNFIELKKTLEDMILKSNEKYVNNVYPVLVDCISKKNSNILTGYTETQKVVNFVGDVSLIGKIVNVKITENRLYYFNGELVDE